MKFSEYEFKDTDMPDCSICLVNFEPKDEIVVYECDPKHYFHKDCGLEWLQNKTECPLCRFDFSSSIKKHKTKANQDELRDVAMETAIQVKGRNSQARNQNRDENDSVNAGAAENRQEVALEEMVRELEQTIADLNRQMEYNEPNQLGRDNLLIVGPARGNRLPVPSYTRSRTQQVFNNNRISPEESS